MRIMALPAFLNRKLNPYNSLLYRAVERAGVRVDEFSPILIVRGAPDVLHIHWPEYLFNAPSLVLASLKSLAFMALIAGARARKLKIIWTIHNLSAHEHWHSRLEQRMWTWFISNVDGYIALTAGGQAAAIERFPELRDRPGFVIPHGHYRDAYPDEITRADARIELGLPANARVIAYLGAIRPYKNVPELIETFRSLPGHDWRLLIAGKPVDNDWRAEIRSRGAQDPRVRMDLGFVPNDRVQVYMRAADLLVLPYQDILNSGSVLLALSFDRPVLVPDRGAMAELQDLVGDEWVRTYRGKLTVQTIREAMTWAETTPRDSGHLMSTLDWDDIARQTVLAYEVVQRVIVPPAKIRRTRTVKRERRPQQRRRGTHGQ